MRLFAHPAKACRIPFKHDPSSPHSTILGRAIFNVLSTDLAAFTYAQIIDGLPTADVAWDRRFPDLPGVHPIGRHEELRPGVMERAREFRRRFDPSMLSFDPKVRGKPTNQPSHTRRITDAAQTLPAFHRATPRLTPVQHDIYPDGVADIAGYWAEDRILGGVTVFGRYDEEYAPDFPPNVYFHSCRRRITKRYYQLCDDQQEALFGSLLAEPNTTSGSPLPILADKTNTIRTNQEDDMVNGFHRDIWDRVPPTTRELEVIRRKPKNTADYPEFEALTAAFNKLPSVTLEWKDGRVVTITVKGKETTGWRRQVRRLRGLGAWMGRGVGACGTEGERTGPGMGGHPSWVPSYVKPSVLDVDVVAGEKVTGQLMVVELKSGLSGGSQAGWAFDGPDTLFDTNILYHPLKRRLVPYPDHNHNPLSY